MTQAISILDLMCFLDTWPPLQASGCVERIGVWFGAGLQNALATRRLLGFLALRFPQADLVLFGPRASLHLFEMDSRVSAYLPLLALEEKRREQSAIANYLGRRAQFKKLKSLNLQACFGVCTEYVKPIKPMGAVRGGFDVFAKALGLARHALLVYTEPALLQTASTPFLEAGPQALLAATHFYRLASPQLPKVLLVLGHADQSLDQLKNAQTQAHDMLHAHGLVADHKACVVWAVLGGESRLHSRLAAHLGEPIRIMSQARLMGHIAYADQVICLPDEAARICVEMGRENRLLLLKTYRS